MNEPKLLFALFFVLWQFTVSSASAQTDPYHCDSLKVSCSDDTKIQIRYFNAPKTCPQNCSFCAAIAKQDWLEIQKRLKQEVKTVPGSPEALDKLLTWLLAHRLVNFVLPPEQEAQPNLAAFIQVGFQVPHMTFTWEATFHQKKTRKARPASWKLTAFRSDSRIYSRLNALGAEFQTLLQSDSLQLPTPLLPDHNYLASWFGARKLSPPETSKLETQIKTHPREAVNDFIENKDGIGLALMMAHQNLAVRYAALQGIKKLQDKNCLPYLLQLAQATIQSVKTTPETEILYSNYCEQLVATIGILTNCNFNRCPFAHYGPQHYLRLGLPTWERKIDHIGGQGIGSYATIH